MTTNNQVDPPELTALVLAAFEQRPARMGMLRAPLVAEPREPERDTQPMRMTMLRRPVE